MPPRRRRHAGCRGSRSSRSPRVSACGRPGARRPIPENPLANAQFSRFTDWEGTEEGAEISPDGKFVAFLADRDGQFDLWVSQVGTGTFSQPHDDMPAAERSRVDPEDLRLFRRRRGDLVQPRRATRAARRWLIPLTGGTPRAFLGEGAAAPILVSRRHAPRLFQERRRRSALLADRTGGDAATRSSSTQKVLSQNGMHNHNPVWSPDGQWIYFAHGSGTDRRDGRVAHSTLGRIAGATDAAARRGESSWRRSTRERCSTWRGRRTESGPWLWALDVETKVTRRVTSGLEHYTSVAASRDGRRVVADHGQPQRQPVARAAARSAGRGSRRPAVPLPSAGAGAALRRDVALLPVGVTGAGDGLWRFQDGSAFEVRKAADDALSEPPAVSPDGTRVAIVVRQEGKRRLAIMSADGTSARTLAPSIEIFRFGGQGSADWSPDGTWIVAGGSDAQGPGLFKIPVDGGEPVRLVAGQAVNPVWSPDGALIVYGGPSSPARSALLGVRPDGTPSICLTCASVRRRPSLPAQWNRSGVPAARSVAGLLAARSRRRKTRPLTHLSDRGILEHVRHYAGRKASCSIAHGKTRTSS